MYKYRINELLSALPVRDYRKALKVLPKALDISLNTFSNYRNIRIGQNQDIPYQKVILLEKIFGLAPGELANISPDFTPIRELLDDKED